MTKAHEGKQERGNKTPLTKEHNQLYNGKLHNDPKLSAARYHLASDKWKYTFDIYTIKILKATSSWMKFHCL